MNKSSAAHIVKKILSNPHQYLTVLSDTLTHKKDDLFSYPSIYPSTPMGSFLPFDYRFKLYNYLFKPYPLYSQVIKLNSENNESDDCNFPLKYNYRSDEFIDLKHLVSRGYCITENFLSQNDYTSILSSLNDALDLPPKATFSYNKNTIFKSLFITESLKLSASNLQKYLQELTYLFFNSNTRISLSVQAIEGKVDDTCDPNTIPHLDRFVPTLKAFYFPFSVNEYQSPFSFAPYSHIVDGFYQRCFKESYHVNRKDRIKPFRSSLEFEQRFPSVNLTSS